MAGTILIVDDEKSQREIIQAILSRAGYEVESSASAREALTTLNHREFDLILTDLKMSGMSGMELMQQVLKESPEQCVVIMTAHGSVDSAVDAMKKGAFDYLEKPLERDSLLLTLRRALEHVRLVRENRLLQRQLAEVAHHDDIIGEHPTIREVYRIIGKIAPTSSTVLIYGESGTGKELVARAIHDRSPRREAPFLAINCAAIPEPLMESELFGHERGAFTGAHSREIGLFEAAQGGTVFLDEIGEMNVAMQAKLLRAIQDREIRRVGGKASIPVDVRIVSATNKDLEAEIRRGAFREDLFYRLNVIRIALPPLRERGSDIAALADFFLHKYAATAGIAPRKLSHGALKLILQYPWPGNVRQLQSVIERGILLAEDDQIQPEDLPLELSQAAPAGLTDFTLPASGLQFEELERSLITQAMERSGGVISKAATLLGMSYKTLQYRLDKFGINKS
jgi:DNA-binding NtrC family response regulator